jgi:2-desacetyl-2-hydroxyethyl bacteriochlorophyllide A dehydrogenase
MDISQKIIFSAPYQADVLQHPIPQLAANQIRIKTLYSLISPGTELAMYTGTHTGISNPANNWAKFPFMPGYALVGVVEELGAEIQQFTVGQHVFAIAPHASHNVMTIGTEEPEAVFALPDGSIPEHAVFARLAAISATSLLQGKVHYGDTAVILGMGLIGQFAAQLYALHGAKVIAVDPVAQRLQIARRTGIAHTLDQPPVSSEIDIVVEATGIPAMVNSALEIVKPRGQVILLGSPRGTAEIKTYEHIHCKGVNLTGAHENIQNIAGPDVRSRYIRHMLQLIANGKLQIEPLLTHNLPAAEAKSAYELLLNAKESTLGVLLNWNHS